MANGARAIVDQRTEADGPAAGRTRGATRARRRRRGTLAAPGCNRDNAKGQAWKAFRPFLDHRRSIFLANCATNRRAACNLF